MVPAVLGCVTLCARKDKRLKENEPHDDNSKSIRAHELTQDPYAISDEKPKNWNITEPEGLKAVSTSTESSDSRSQSNAPEVASSSSTPDSGTNDVVVEIPEDITSYE